MAPSTAADALLDLLSAAEDAIAKPERRLHKPRRPYRCGRCGLPKRVRRRCIFCNAHFKSSVRRAGHVCALRREQRTAGVQTDHTCLTRPGFSLSLVTEASGSSANSESEDDVRCITEDAHSDAEASAAAERRAARRRERSRSRSRSS